MSVENTKAVRMGGKKDTYIDPKASFNSKTVQPHCKRNWKKGEEGHQRLSVKVSR
jgi:hypothetical protein